MMTAALAAMEPSSMQRMNTERIILEIQTAPEELKGIIGMVANAYLDGLIAGMASSGMPKGESA